MSSVKIEGNASGTGIFTIASPNSNTNRTLTIPDATTTIVGTDATQTLTNKTLGSGLVAGASLLTSGTAITLTNQTAPEFTGIPSWVKRITVMFSGVSTNYAGSSNLIIQLGDSGGFETTGYSGSGGYFVNAGASAVVNFTTGFGVILTTAANSLHGIVTICLLNNSNLWAASGTLGRSDGVAVNSVGGTKTLSDTLDRIRLTTVNGTDQFDAGSINILYE